MKQKIRVGLVGANAQYGWGKTAHVPAIRAVESLELAGVATRNLETAGEAAEAFGATKAFADFRSMVNDPDIDLVAVALRAPMHMDVVAAALSAGKHVYCEWPLGNGLAQTLRLSEMARAAGTRCAVGLQGRMSPWVRQTRDLVADGYVGRVLSTTLVASDDLSTGEIAASNRYMLDAANRANPLTIHGGHFLDCLCFAVGEFDTISATVATTRPDVTIKESGEQVTANAPDQIAVAGTLASGAIASVHIRAGSSPHGTLMWEIQGDRGFLRITSRSGYMHWRPLVIEGAQGNAASLAPLPPPPAAPFDFPGLAEGPARHVAYSYAALARDIESGTQLSADFEDAAARHRMIDAIETAARTGIAQAVHI